jgi:putative tricarboxylic transport membrane protein
MSEGVDTSPKPPGFGSYFRNASNLRGGLLVTLLSLGLFVWALYIKSVAVEATVLTMSGALVAVGLAVTAGLIPVRAPQDFYGGLALVMLATLAMLASAELPGQRGFAFGPGTAPRLFAVVLAALGAAIAVAGLVGDGPRIEKYHIRGPVLVIGAILSFAAMIRGFTIPFIGISIPPLGLIPATFFTFMISIFGSKEMRFVESLIAAGGMTVFCVVLFVYLLNLPFQLWPRFY